MRPWAPHPLLQSKRFHKISVFKWFSFQCFVSQCLWLSLCSVHRSPPNLVFFLFILTCLIPVVIWVCNSKLTPQPSPLTAVFIFMNSFPGLEHTSLTLCSRSHAAHAILYFLSSLNTRSWIFFHHARHIFHGYLFKWKTFNNLLPILLKQLFILYS